MCDPWPIAWTCGEPSGVTPENLAIATDAAQRILWARTGRRLGLCTVTEHYRPQTGVCGLPSPYMDRRGFWHNARRGCSCSLRLRQSPLWAVSSVLVAGTPVTGYEVEGNTLRHPDGCWPAVPDCDPAGIEITYTWGIPLRPAVVAPDPNPRPADPLWSLAAAAMGEVAKEVAEGMCGNPCRLPNTAVTITRQGVTVARASTAELAAKGYLGLPIADELIRTVNPQGLRSRSRVYSPDMARVY